jgi:two-component system phosphate regulon sensor histidine kinase PhoR
MILAERLRAVSELLVTMSGSPVPAHLFQTLADNVGGVVACDCVAVCLQDPDGGGYRVHSLSVIGLPDGPFELAQGLPGLVMRTGRAVRVEDLGADGGGALESTCRDAGLKAALLVPLRRGPEVLGALFFAALPPTTYDEDDAQVATLIAAGLSAALETSRAYQALADERGTMAAVLGSTQDAVLMINSDGLVLLANPAVQGMLGVSPEALVGRWVIEALEHRPLLQIFAAGRPGTSEVPLPDGRIAQASLVEVVTAYGEPVGTAAVLRDITVLKRLEQTKNEFVAAVSHDLKSPIMVMSVTAELMLRGGVPDEEKLQAYCGRIIRTAESMHALVTELLDLGKIESGLEPPAEPEDLVPVIVAVVGGLSTLAESRAVAIETSLPESAVVRAVSGRLQQVMANLVGNALKYTPDGGRVRVSMTIADGQVTVEVADTGIGIPAADLPFVFDKFYRVKTKATAGIAGTGLGLALVRSIIDAHGGRISVQSVAGQGSTFVFSLPAAPESDAR